MPVIKIGDLTTFAGDPSGSYLVINDSASLATYKIQREALIGTSFSGTASWSDNALTASYVENSQTASFVTGSSVWGPFGSNSIVSASYATTASLALNQNLEIDTWATSSDNAHLYFPFKFNNDAKGPGTITLTNGSSTVTGTGTSFLDTGYVGVRYWFNLIVRDSSTGTWYIIVTNVPTSNTAVTINEVFSRTDVINGFYNQSIRPSTWTGTSGTYEYWVVRNFSDGPFSNSIGNRSYASNYGFAVGGSNVALGGFAAGLSTYTVNPGNTAATFGKNTIASGSYTFAMGNYTQATGRGAFAGGGFFGTNFSNNRQRFVTNLRRLISTATGSFNFSGNNDSQTVDHGALADFSAILGGINHNVPSTSPRSAIIGGNAIKADANRPDTVYVPNLQVTGSSFINGNLIVTGSITGSLLGTASWARNALTASSADNFFVRQNITASNALITGTIIAQTLSVQYITASTELITGSSKFGTQLTDTHQFTGSVSITGSLTVDGTLTATSSYALNALSSSYALTASYVENSQTASFVTGSNVWGPLGSNSVLSASYALTSSVAGYSSIQESQYRFQNITVIDQDVWLNSGSIVKVVTSSGVSTAEYSLNGGSYSAFSFTGDTWTGNISVAPKDTFSWRITYRSGYTTAALIVVSNITVI